MTMKASDLFSLWNGDAVSRVSDFAGVERKIGMPLPADFKELLGVFGWGSFGELCLFHPQSSFRLTRLPEATLELHEALSAAQEFIMVRIPPKPSLEMVILGILPPRQCLFWNGSLRRWSMLDSELSELTDLGEDLPSFLHTTFFSQKGVMAVQSHMTWGERSGSCAVSFFRPAKTRP